MSKDGYKAGVWLTKNGVVSVFFADHADLKAAQAAFSGKAILCREDVGFVLPSEKKDKHSMRIYELAITGIQEEGAALLNELHASKVNTLNNETIRTIDKEAKEAAYIEL